MYDAKTVAQKRKVAEEYLKAQFRLYREMKAEYEGMNVIQKEQNLITESSQKQ